MPQVKLTITQSFIIEIDLTKKGYTIKDIAELIRNDDVAMDMGNQLILKTNTSHVVADCTILDDKDVIRTVEILPEKKS
jgi:hypothetical protein